MHAGMCRTMVVTERDAYIGTVELDPLCDPTTYPSAIIKGSLVFDKFMGAMACTPWMVDELGRTQKEVNACRPYYA